MRTVRLALCLVGLAMLYPAVSNAAQICYSAYVPLASPHWRSGCDGEIAGTTGHSWGVTLYAIQAPDPSVGGGDICYDVYTPHGWFSQCDGTPIGYGNDGIQLVRVSYYTGPATLQYRAHVGGIGWEQVVNYNQVVGEVGHGVEALEVNIHLPNDPPEYWQQS